MLSLVTLQLAIGLLLIGRRLAGALTLELPWYVLLTTAVVMMTLVTLARIAWRRAFPVSSLSVAGEWMVGWGASLGLVLAAVGCSFPAFRTSDWLVWLPILVADQLLRQSFLDAGQHQLRLSEIGDACEEPPIRRASASSQRRQDEVVQQLYRVRDNAGREVIYGTLRADFQVGQRSAVLHVGFCPPLEYLPEIEAAALPDRAARLKVVQALAHGARLDVRLPETPTENCSIWIDMAARPAAETRVVTR
jgi:hypothetical protein